MKDIQKVQNSFLNLGKHLFMDCKAVERAFFQIIKLLEPQSILLEMEVLRSTVLRPIFLTKGIQELMSKRLKRFTEHHITVP